MTEEERSKFLQKCILWLLNRHPEGVSRENIDFFVEGVNCDPNRDAIVDMVWDSLKRKSFSIPGVNGMLVRLFD